MEDFVPPYTSFAAAYDKMMENVDYVRWADYVDKLFAHYNLRPRRVLDMACGTGSTAILLAEKGYLMSGSDRAMEMLLSARDKAEKKGIPLQLWQQDMRDLAVSQPYDAVLCLYDSINYITTEEEMKQVFTRVSEALGPKGVFIFDVTTEYNIVKHFDRQTFAESNEYFSYIWRNLYFHKEKLCKTVLTFFLREDGDYRKYEEFHVQKIYSVAQIRKLLDQTGYNLLSSFDAFSFNRWSKISERINFTAVKKQ
ncbi:class I SAM-dependent DNA methyltransferase [Candidatus Poribacteria bacterium]